MKNEVKWYHIVVLVAVAGLLVFFFRDKSGIALGKGPIDAEEAKVIMYELLQGPVERQRLVDRIVEADDKRFIIVLMDTYALQDANGYKSGENVGPIAILNGLETLSGVEFGDSCSEWFTWYRTTDYEPPPGYSGWKGLLLSLQNRALRDYFTEDMPATIRLGEIVWSGTSEDALPPLDDPALLSAEDAMAMADEDAVVGIYLNDQARAYPLRIIDSHEMVNDTIGETPVSLAYCTLCNAAIAYERTTSDGAVHRFESSGCLYRSNKLMADLETKSLWNQMTGEPVTGVMVERGVSLTKLPTVTTTWAEWKLRHPDTMVLSDTTGHYLDYTPGHAYGDYFSGDSLRKYVKATNELLPAKETIYGIHLDGHAKAWTVDHLVTTQVVNDILGETEIVLIASPKEVIVKGLARGKRDVEYSAGAEVRAYASEGRTFSLVGNREVLMDESGMAWTLTENALTNSEGVSLKRIPGHLAYWFGWSTFYADTELVRSTSGAVAETLSLNATAEATSL